MHSRSLCLPKTNIGAWRRIKSCFRACHFTPVSDPTARSSQEKDMTKSHLHAARDAIQTQIASHERQIQDLRTKLNEILPISGLPDEVLCHTFMYLKSLVHPDDTSLASSPRAWISITTHVCRRWRNAAINYAPLWASLTSRLGPTWFGEMLERSQGALLSLEILTRNTFRARGVHCWQQLATQTLLQPSRLSDVVLDVFATTLKELVLALRVPFPKITRLVLRSHESGFTPPIWLPADLLGGDAPQLQELLLEGCILPWTSPILQTITTLTWSTRELEEDDDEENEDDEETFTVPFNHALNALCKMPQLIHLDLGVQISKPYDPSSVKDIASLPNLKELRLKGGCAEYGSLLACLRIPTQCVLHLDLARADEADISALGEALKSCWLAPPSPSDHPIPFDRLTIAQISSSLWCNDILKILCYNPCKEVSLNLQLGISIPNWNTNFTQTFISSFPLEGIRTLFDEFIIHGPTEWEAAFTHLDLLEDLTVSAACTDPKSVSGNPVKNLLELLKEDPGLSCEGLDVQRVPGYLPKLSKLKFHKVAFGKNGSVPSELLYDVLRLRARSGRPFVELSFHGCTGLPDTSPQLEPLESFAGTVVQTSNPRRKPPRRKF